MLEQSCLYFSLTSRLLAPLGAAAECFAGKDMGLGASSKVGGEGWLSLLS